uniref:Uncharacterized protein n=1 Tax=Ciona savignyi TaxID=51511 RepID=H2YY15_CIOSA
PVIKEEHVTQKEFPQEKKKTQRYWSRRRKFRFNPKKPNVPEKKRKLDIPDVQEPQPKILEIKEEQHDEISEDTDGSTSSGSDSSDNENPTRKRQDKSTIVTSQMDWMKSLPQFQQESENEPQLKKMRYVPSILRRSRNPQSSNQLSNIKIVSCVSLADPLSESTPPSSTNVSPPCSSAASVDGPTSDNDSSEEDATDDD